MTRAIANRFVNKTLRFLPLPSGEGRGEGRGRSQNRSVVTLLFAVFGVVGLTVGGAQQAHAQSSGVVLTGSIADAAGETMEGVVVSVRAEGSNLTTSVYTDADGVFVFPRLAPGPFAGLDRRPCTSNHDPARPATRFWW